MGFLTLHAADGRFHHAACGARGAPARRRRRAWTQLMPTLEVPEGVENSMDRWMMVRKGATAIHLSYGHTFTNNLHAYKMQIRDEPEFEIRIDLTSNLNKRDKETDTYIDAKELADGKMRKLLLIQIEDERLFKVLDDLRRRSGTLPNTWHLTIQLQREWQFVVRPEVKGTGKARSLLLQVDDYSD